jgi:predicted metalloprotease
MKWEGNRESDNVEDTRGSGGGGGGGFGLGGGTLGIGSIVIALVGSYFFGVSPLTILSMLNGGGGGQSAPTQQAPAGPPANDRMTKFVRVVLADTEDTWSAVFKERGATYEAPKLEIFSGRTQTQCGPGMTASGPFYCPADRKVYIDLSFYKLMQERFNVSGEFAQAYVIAHEVGHHVQNLMGISAKVENARRNASQSQANAMSVRLELQADCFAGLWAKRANEARGIIESGDVEAAMAAATAIGDDALQRQAQGHVVPDSFTHGTSAQRTRWFRTGLDSGKVEACNTFSAGQL